MRLHEVADSPFQQEPYASIGDEYQHLQDKHAAMEDIASSYEEQVREFMNALQTDYTAAGWKDVDEKAKEMAAKGAVACYWFAADGSTRINGWFKPTPANKDTLNKFLVVQNKLIRVKARLFALNEQIEKCKARYQAWKRRQPGYVGRDETTARERKLGEKVVEELRLKCGKTIMRYSYSRTKQRGDSILYLFLFEQYPGETEWKKTINKVKPIIQAYMDANGYTTGYSNDKPAAIRISKYTENEFEVRITVDTKQVITKNA